MNMKYLLDPQCKRQDKENDANEKLFYIFFYEWT